MERIPKQESLEIYNSHKFIDSPLILVPNDCGIIIDMQYPKMDLKSAITDCMLRKEVVEMLVNAQKHLPSGYALKIWDAYRPLALQKELFYFYKPMIIKEFNLANMPLEEQEAVIRNYVSLPIEDEEIPPLHATGGSVDLTIVDLSTGKNLEMGTEFDSFSALTNTSSFEEDNMSEEVRNNRRMLYWTMINSGFTNLPSEWWHFDYGNRAWGFYQKKPAIYKGILKL